MSSILEAVAKGTDLKHFNERKKGFQIILTQRKLIMTSEHVQYVK